MNNKKIKVLIIPTGGMGVDGITSSIMNYYEYLDHSNIKMTFVVTKIKGDKENFNNIIGKIIKNGDKVIKIPRSKNIIIYFIKLLKLIKENNFDIIHVHGSSSIMAIELLAARMGGIPARISHSHNTKCNHNIVNKILRPLFNKLTNYRLACGKEAGIWLFGNNDFTVLNNGIDIEKFSYSHEQRCKMRKKLNLENKKVIGHVGNFNRQKNHSFIIDILSEIIKSNPDFHVILIGDGINRKKIENKINESNLSGNITLLGRRNDIPDILQAADIMILPSFYEGLPVSVIEWQASGLKSIVSTCVTSEVKITELVNFMALEDGAKKWASKIQKEINYKRDCYTNAKLIEKGYDIKTSANKLIEIYFKNYNKNKSF